MGQVLHGMAFRGILFLVMVLCRIWSHIPSISGGQRIFWAAYSGADFSQRKESPFVLDDMRKQDTWIHRGGALLFGFSDHAIIILIGSASGHEPSVLFHKMGRVAVFILRRYLTYSDVATTSRGEKLTLTE